MKSIARKVAVGSAFALFASTALTGAASAQTGSLASGSLGSLAPGFTNPNTLAAETELDEVTGDYVCDQNYFDSTEKWEINWGKQHSDAGLPEWNKDDFDGLTYIDPQYTTKTPAEELAIAEGAATYYQWYPTRDMVSEGAKLTLGFEDGTVILAEAQVGTDKCPSFRWTVFPEDGEAATITPTDFPAGVPAPTRPALPSDPPTGSLDSLFGS